MRWMTADIICHLINDPRETISLEYLDFFCSPRICLDLSAFSMSLTKHLLTLPHGLLCSLVLWMPITDVCIQAHTQQLLYPHASCKLSYWPTRLLAFTRFHVARFWEHQLKSCRYRTEFVLFCSNTANTNKKMIQFDSMKKHVFSKNISWGIASKNVSK